MPELSEDQLERLHHDWDRIDVVRMQEASNMHNRFEDLLERFEGLGLDTQDDATYALLEEGMTKAQFDDMHDTAIINAALSYYHWLSRSQDQEYSGYETRRAACLKRILEVEIPQAKAVINERGAPNHLTAMAEQEIRFLIDLEEQGVLQQDLKRTAFVAAQIEFRTLVRLSREMDAANESGKANAQRHGLAAASQAIQLIDLAGDLYQPVEVIVESNRAGGWPDKRAPKVTLSREAVLEMQKPMLAYKLSHIFTQACRFQAEGHFVLDKSGSGHGMMALPVQEVAEELDKAGFDLSDPETYAFLGSDIATFRSMYQREREAVQQDEEYSHLVKPAFTI